MELERAGLDGNNGKSAERTAVKSTNRSRNDSDLRVRHTSEMLAESYYFFEKGLIDSSDAKCDM